MTKPSKKEFEKLGKKIDRLDKKIDAKVNGLALITKKGFDGVDKRFEGIESRLTNIGIELTNLKTGQEQTKEEIKKEIKESMTGVVYRFEFEALDKRLQRVELKLGLSRPSK